MSKTRFKYNPDTISYEKIEFTFKKKLKRFSRIFLSGLFWGVVFFFLANHFIQSPNEKILRSEYNQLLAQYKLLNQDMTEMQRVLIELEQRDNSLYRALMGTDPIPLQVRQHVVNSESRYVNLKNARNEELINKTTIGLDKLKKQLYVQSKSYDEIVELTKTQKDKLLHIPAIQPVLNKNLKRTASGYGIRLDPIYKTKKFHKGMDFSAPIGTKVFATGNGTISFLGWKQGYGNCIIIDHGYGYKTLYAHLHKFNVKKGAKVTRGSVIAFVGNTGKSTGPHLHYEVHLNGKAIDPRNYYYLDLTPKEYDEMVILMSNYGYVFD